VAPIASFDADLDDLARVLEREERLLAVTEAAPGAAAADALRRLRREELHRALIVAEVSAARTLRPGAGWHDLLAAIPEHRASTLRAHAERLRASPALPPSLRDFLDS
jgi:hypothetical protein